MEPPPADSLRALPVLAPLPAGILQVSGASGTDMPDDHNLRGAISAPY